MSTTLEQTELCPLSIEDLRSLKAKEDERIRLEKERIRLESIKCIVTNLYRTVVHRAKRSTETVFRCSFEQYFKDYLTSKWKHGIEVFNSQLFQEQKQFWDTNIRDIEATLMGLFPQAVRLEENNTVVVDWS